MNLLSVEKFLPFTTFKDNNIIFSWWNYLTIVEKINSFFFILMSIIFIYSTFKLIRLYKLSKYKKLYEKKFEQNQKIFNSIPLVILAIGFTESFIVTYYCLSNNSSIEVVLIPLLQSSFFATCFSLIYLLFLEKSRVLI
jgi:membrane protein insertase Oxa1/YidC/SpoIIIJ